MRRKLKAVLDTNIFISAILGGSCRKIFDLFSKRAFLLVLSDSILDEIKGVFLEKDLFDNIPSKHIDEFLEAVCSNAEFIISTV